MFTQKTLRCVPAVGLMFGLMLPNAVSANTTPKPDDIGQTKDSIASVLASAVQVSAGFQHTCVLTTVGGVKCWGANQYGQLGDGTTIDRHTPVDVNGLTNGVSSVMAERFHTCALTTIGGVKCWGYNLDGELGDGTTIDRHTPVNVSGLAYGVGAISKGGNHTCALTIGGGVKCWGWNKYGSIGDGTTTDRHTPVDVSGLTYGVSAISAGSIHTCALTTDRGMMCWGFNRDGQLGDGTSIERHTPVNVSGLPNEISITNTGGGGYHTCVLVQENGAKCWGWNDSGQLGDGTTISRNIPINVSGLTSSLDAISIGGIHTCALTTGGKVKCWGYNFDGQLGNGTRIDQHAPVDVSGLESGITAISAGTIHTCALTNLGGVKCWGNNDYGQLGDGTTTDRLTPVDVIGFGGGNVLPPRIYLPLLSK